MSRIPSEPDDDDTDHDGCVFFVIAFLIVLIIGMIQHCKFLSL